MSQECWWGTREEEDLLHRAGKYKLFGIKKKFTITLKVEEVDEDWMSGC